MKSLKHLFLVIAAAGLLGACEREKEQAPASPIEGIWQIDSYVSDVSATDTQVEECLESALDKNAKVNTSICFHCSDHVTKGADIPVYTLTPGGEPQPSFYLDYVIEEIFTGAPELTECMQLNYLRSDYRIAGDSLIVTDHFEGGYTYRETYAMTLEDDGMTWIRDLDPEKYNHIPKLLLPESNDFEIYSIRETITLRRN